MLFAVDVGNSHTVSGIFTKGRLVGNWRLQSRQDRTADELAIRYHGLFQMAGIDPKKITGFIVASVVPTLETSWLHFARNYLTRLRQPPLAVTHTLKLGMSVATETPAEVGADRIVNAVAAWERFHSPLIVIDFGTAITFDCVNEQPAYVGGTIHPGIGISLDALATRTAKLPRLDIDVIPEQPIGTTTVKAIHSGALYGFGGLVDRMVEVLSRQLTPDQERAQAIATGGMAELIKPYTKSIDIIDPHLTLTGLSLIYRLNCDGKNE
ncbi:type III pantothenate kinase [Desulfobulbus alkaliphilus]|uniref:type III pantothenate kinase n=1 Tax=Desulfobulbus alkaliphilus TaxID=869814 RepID=UPI0019665FD6|nr:type III pantothenate kinase [Desulfobulbus alkaliphilus]MBM9535790.1 type III pantothenate kinase [Desulfobulbus alkaliphilus]